MAGRGQWADLFKNKRRIFFMELKVSISDIRARKEGNIYVVSTPHGKF
ncbi:MAG: hypothetical protein ACP5I3_12095 [Thermoproteus sp.]